jgi:hypothetical protein
MDTSEENVSNEIGNNAENNSSENSGMNMAESKPELKEETAREFPPTPAAPQIPTPGRMVNYIPCATGDTAQNNGCTVVPAIVVQVSGDGLKLNLNVFTVNETNPVQLRMDVPHKSEVVDVTTFVSYWEWPVYSVYK